MTQEEIIEMARQADCLHVNLTGDRAKALERLEAFAKLVAEKEREAWSKVCEDIRKVFNEKADLAYIAGQKEEREACAMLCLWHNNTMLSQTPTLFHMAQLIRERGQA